MEKHLERFFEMSLRRLYSAENQVYEQLAVVAEKAVSDALKEAFSQHRRETAYQIDRLKKIFEMLNFDLAKTKIGEAEGLFEKGKEMVKGLATMAFAGKSKTMEGLIEEVQEMARHFEGSSISDFVLISGGKGIESAEVTAYEMLIFIAEAAGMKGVVELLKNSLSEEKHAHEVLLQLGKKELLVAQKAM